MTVKPSCCRFVIYLKLELLYITIYPAEINIYPDMSRNL